MPRAARFFAITAARDPPLRAEVTFRVNGCAP